MKIKIKAPRVQLEQFLRDIQVLGVNRTSSTAAIREQIRKELEKK